MKSTLAPFARPLYVMSKPIGSACNLACDYCYYLEKSHLLLRVGETSLNRDCYSTKFGCCVTKVFNVLHILVVF